jgi:DNA-binding response OmpR family regulator
MADQKRILIIEDEGAIARAMQFKLENSGFTAEIAGNGKVGISNLEKNTYDMILLDLMMPVVDGFGVLEAMKEKKVKTPVIVLTNLSQPEDEEKVKKLGALDFFVKADVPIADIVEYINKYFKKGS